MNFRFFPTPNGKLGRIALVIFSGLALIDGSPGQEMTGHEKSRFLAMVRKDTPYDVFTEAKWLSESYPDDPILKKIRFALDGKFGELANRQLAVTAVYGSGDIFCVFGQTIHPYGGQVFHLSKEIPRDWIKKNWQEQYSVTSIAGCDSGWLTVMSRKRDGRKPRYGQIFNTFRDAGSDLQTFIDTAWKKDKKVSHIASGGGLWWVMASEMPGWGAQRFTCKASWPEKWIGDRLNEGYFISSVASGLVDNSTHYFVVMTKDNSSSSMVVSSKDRRKWIGTKRGYGQWMIRGGFHFSGREPGWFVLLNAPQHRVGAWSSASGGMTEITESISKMRNGTIWDK